MTARGRKQVHICKLPVVTVKFDPLLPELARARQKVATNGF
jgi:hypothetical protein